MPLRFEAAILSRIRSPVTSRSKCAKDSSTQREPPHRAGGVELLGNGHEADTLFIELLHDLGEIGQGTGEPVDLVDHDRIDPPCSDVHEQLLQAGSVHVATREATIVVLSLDDLPAFMLLAQHIGFTCLALSVQGIEALIEAFFR